MSKLSAFLQPLETEKQREVVISRRFVKRNEKGEPLLDKEGNYIPEPFVVRALSPEENDRLVKRCTHTMTVRGQRVETFDRQEYTRRAIVEATVEPNFRDPAMAERYGTMVPEEIPGKMLNIAEYAALADAILEVSGFDEESANTLLAEAKN